MEEKNIRRNFPIRCTHPCHRSAKKFRTPKAAIADRVSSLIGVNVAGNIQPLCHIWAQPCQRKRNSDLVEFKHA